MMPLIGGPSVAEGSGASVPLPGPSFPDVAGGNGAAAPIGGCGGTGRGSGSGSAIGVDKFGVVGETGVSGWLAVACVIGGSDITGSSLLGVAAAGVMPPVC